MKEWKKVGKGSYTGLLRIPAAIPGGQPAKFSRAAGGNPKP